MGFETLITNKYVCIALLLTLLVTLYMYSQRQPCAIEKMTNVDLTGLAHELVENPWADDKDTLMYKTINRDFDRNADARVIQNLKKKGYNITEPLKRSDENFNTYDNISKKKCLQSNKYNDIQYSEEEYETETEYIPKPLDSRPDLGQCQPCNCDDKPTRKYKNQYK